MESRAAYQQGTAVKQRHKGQEEATAREGPTSVKSIVTRGSYLVQQAEWRPGQLGDDWLYVKIHLTSLMKKLYLL